MRFFLKKLTIAFGIVIGAVSANAAREFSRIHFFKAGKVAETYQDLDGDKKIDILNLAAENRDQISIRLNANGTVEEIDIRHSSSVRNALAKWRKIGDSVALVRYLSFPKRKYNSSDEDFIEELDKSIYSDRVEMKCHNELLLDYKNIYKKVSDYFQSSKFKDRISNSCEIKKNNLTKEDITKSLFAPDDSVGAKNDLVNCMRKVSEIVDKSDDENDDIQRCAAYKGAFGGLKNLLLLDNEGETKFKITCELDSQISDKECLSGNFNEGKSGAGDSIVLKVSPKCAKIPSGRINTVVKHEMLHRVIPSVIKGSATKEEIESAVAAFEEFCRNSQADAEVFCGLKTGVTGKFPVTQARAAQAEAVKIEPPAELMKETPASRIVVPGAFRAMNLYLSNPSVAASAVPTGAAAVAEAQNRIGPVLSWARSMMAAVDRAQASQNLDPNKTYEYTSPDAAKEERLLTGQSGQVRFPASEGKVNNAKTSVAKGVDGSGSSAVNTGGLRTTFENNATAAQIADRQAHDMALRSAKLNPEQKKVAEEVFAYVLRAGKDTSRLKTYLVQKNKALRNLQIYVVDPREQQVFGYDDNTSANMILSISPDGKLIDETLAP